MNELKKEFEDKIGYKLTVNCDAWNNIRNVDVAGLFKWIEQQIKDAKVDELDNIKFFDNGMHAGYYTILEGHIENRIKEVNNV